MRENDPATEPAGTEDGEPQLDDEAAAELSRAAREAVRQPADPRIDRQLARMGLAPLPEEDAGAATPPERPSGRAAPTAIEMVRSELDGVRDTLAATRESLDGTRSRLDMLTWVVIFMGISIAILAVLLLLR
jgi:hypothetical protein